MASQDKLLTQKGKQNTVLGLYLVYTLAFGILFITCFFFLFRQHKTFVYGGDAWSQGYTAMRYYGRYLRSVLKQLGQGDFTIPQWDFAIGEGGDIIQTFHYYVMGDPFSIGALLVPDHKMYLYYMASTVLRVFLTGIAFIAYSLYKKAGLQKVDRFGILIGALLYAFSGWNIFNVVRYPYFINCLIFFPFILLGMEKILDQKKSLLFSIAIALSALSSFYFFFMIVLATVLYAAIRLIGIYKRDVKKIVVTVGRLIAYALLGVLLAAPILCPILYAVLHSSRGGISHPSHLFYSLDYYRSLLWNLVNGTETKFTMIGIGAPILGAEVFFLSRKGNRQEKVFLLVAFAILCFPGLGKLMNGNSYISNRFCWILVFAICYTVALGVSNFMQLFETIYKAVGKADTKELSGVDKKVQQGGDDVFQLGKTTESKKFF